MPRKAKNPATATPCKAKNPAIYGYTTLRIAELTPMPSSTVRDMRRRGFFSPEIKGKWWSLRQVIGLCVLYHSRRQGSTMAAALGAYDLLRTISDVQLNTSFEDAREFLVLTGDNISPRLVTHAKAFDVREIEAAAEDHRPYVVVNVKLAFERVLRITEKFETEITDTDTDAETETATVQ